MKKNIVIIGYSGHSYGCVEIALEQGFLIYGYYDIKENSSNPFNLEYLGKEDCINLNYKPFITVGDNDLRHKIYDKLKFKNIDCSTILRHPNSTVSKFVSIEEQTLINAGVIINSQVKIGVGCILNSGSIIEHECVIGSFTHIAPGAVLTGNVSVGNRCLIGANSVIKQGVKIGDNVIIGAGAVVLKDVNSNTTVAGNPAREI